MQIEIDEIAKTFGVTSALHPVSLSIPSGALVALLGPSGSGKTTLLRILGGLEFPTSGQVRFNGQDATGLTRRVSGSSRPTQAICMPPLCTATSQIFANNSSALAQRTMAWLHSLSVA